MFFVLLLCEAAMGIILTDLAFAHGINILSQTFVVIVAVMFLVTAILAWAENRA